MSIQSSVMIGGASEAHKRREADFYPTPTEVTEALLRVFPKYFSNTVVWEPACGDGAISRVLERSNNKVISTDLNDQGYGKPNVNFLTAPLPANAKAIVTNPPFDLAQKFILHACSFGVPVAILLKATYWNAKSRIDLLRNTGPIAVCPLTWRPKFCPDRGSAPTMDFMWTVWGPKPAKLPYFFLLEK
jgi:hypothetical protein